MSDKKLPIFREILCDLCDSKHTKQCDRDEFQPRCIHLQAMLNNVIAEAQLEAVEKYISEHMLDSKRWCEGRSHNYTDKYLAELRKAAGRGE